LAGIFADQGELEFFAPMGW